jgi:uncharacterized membrane protein
MIDASDTRVVEWTSRPNCSLTPRQLLGAFGAICVASLAVAGFFWSQGVRMVLPFAGLELVGLTVALWVHVRHVGDAERIALRGGRLTVDRDTGHLHEHVEFETARVRVERPETAGALVRLSGQGRQVSVGRHVRPHQRLQLAEELRMALSSAR